MSDPTRKINSLEDAQKILEEKGIASDAILGAGTDAYGEENHIWQCPICKSYIDTMRCIEGRLTGKNHFVIFDTSLVQCPECFCRGDRFDSVEGEHRDPRHRILKARVLHNPFAWASKYLSIARAMVAEHGMFKSDPQFDPEEPKWPADMAAVILGSAMMLGSIMKYLVRQGPGPEDGPEAERRSDLGASGKKED